MKLAAMIAFLGFATPAAAAEELPALAMKDVQLSYSQPAEKFIPALARLHGFDGSAKLRCVISSDGALTSCAKVSESPVGVGYLDTARKMAAVAKASPASLDGTPTAGRALIFEVTFKFCRHNACERAARDRLLAAGREP